MEGWSDSIIGRGKTIIHYYKDGASLCGRATVNNGHKEFETSSKTINDSYSCYCKMCIKKSQTLK